MAKSIVHYLIMDDYDNRLNGHSFNTKKEAVDFIKYHKDWKKVYFRVYEDGLGDIDYHVFDNKEDAEDTNFFSGTLIKKVKRDSE